MKNPSQFLNVLGKLYVFAYTWSIGGNFHRQEDVDEDDNVNRRGQDKVEKDINICNEFDNFMRELFEVEPPLGILLFFPHLIYCLCMIEYRELINLFDILNKNQQEFEGKFSKTNLFHF